jgi:glycerol-3-phosphate dehydrogenase subunit C
MGAKAAELLRLVPDTAIDVIERCSGHGGTFGVVKPTHAVAMKIGRPVMRQTVTQARAHVASDCPLAGKHIVRGARELAEKEGTPLSVREAEHPIEIFARAYGLI